MYERKILLGFIRAHILHHAVKDGSIYGAEMMVELKRHGYDISPGTLYPILHEMEDGGLLESETMTVKGKVRKLYRPTAEGERSLEKMKEFIKELAEEVTL
ncbi:MAG: PadR family transcriptional regulator [Thermoplasmatota archaeon]